jgi:hypothetical protein
MAKEKKEKFVSINGVQWTPEMVKEKIAKSDKAVKAALLRLYSWQTEEEKVVEGTKVNNGLGFNGTDAPFLTSLAKQLEEKGWLSAKQITIARKKLSKYSRQIFDHHIMAQRQEVYDKFNL